MLFYLLTRVRETVKYSCQCMFEYNKNVVDKLWHTITVVHMRKSRNYKTLTFEEIEKTS